MVTKPSPLGPHKPVKRHFLKVLVTFPTTLALPILNVPINVPVSLQSLLPRLLTPLVNRPPATTWVILCATPPLVVAPMVSVIVIIVVVLTVALVPVPLPLHPAVLPLLPHHLVVFPTASTPVSLPVSPPLVTTEPVQVIVDKIVMEPYLIIVAVPLIYVPIKLVPAPAVGPVPANSVVL